MATDAHGVEICPPVPCPECGDMVSTRPDGSIRNHARIKSALHPRLGVEHCPGSTPREPAERSKGESA